MPGRSPFPLPHPDTLIAVGIIRKSHGVRGEASVDILTSSVERLTELVAVYLVSPDRKRLVEARIKAVRPHKDRALVMLEGIASPEAVSELRGWSIEIPESETRELEEGEYFLHDLVGLVVQETGGRQIGQIVSIDEAGPQLLLNVRRADGLSFPIPFAAELCPEIDLEGRRMIVNLPEGLEDLTSPASRKR